MRKFFVYFLILGVLTIAAQLIWAQLPKTMTTGHSEDGYFAHKALLSGGSMEATIAEAKKELAQRIFRNTNSLFNPRQKQAKHKWMRAEEAYSPALYNLKNMTKRPADAHLVKLMATQPQATDSDRYVYVNVKHQELMHAYVERENALKRQINTLVANARQTEAVNPDQALLAYLKASPLYEQLKEAVLIQQMAQPQQNQDSAKILAKLMETATGTSAGTLEMSLPDVTNRINQLQHQGRLMNTMQDITASIAYQLSVQAKGLKKGKVMVHPFTNGRSPNPIPAEDFYVQLFERLRTDGWAPELVSRGFIPETVSLSLQGKISSGGDNAELRIRATVHDLNTSETVGKSALNVNPKLEFTFKTENSDELQRHDDAWDSASADTAPSQGLQLTAWTDNPNGIYHSGDRMTVYCRVNKSAYVRLLYVLDDAGKGGLKYTLLHDSTYIDSTQAGTDVTIGRFVATPPFGSEELIVLAREEPFPKVTTIEEGDGYRYLKAKSAEEAVAMMTLMERGMQVMPINERIGIVTKESGEFAKQ